VTIAKRPSEWDGMAGVLWVIWANHEADYFRGEDWTTQISLRLLSNLVFWRKGRDRFELPKIAAKRLVGAV